MRGRYSSSGTDRRERSLVLMLAGLAVLVLLVGRLFTLQVFSSERSRELAQKNWLKPESVPGPRGRILDRRGEILADMIPSFTITVDPHLDSFVRHPERLDSTLVRLAALSEGDVDRYRRIVQSERGISYNPIRLRRNADSTLVARVEEHRSVLPGVAVQVEPIRFYPADTLAAHVLGYVNEVGQDELDRLTDQGYRPGSLIGRTGIERQYEDQLRGEDGIRYVEVNAMGRRSEAFIRAQPVPPKPGRDLVLTLDAGLQRILEQALDEARYDGHDPPPEVKGAAVVMDVRTGEILAMASRPAFDPNIFSRSMSQEEWNRLVRPSAPLVNRAIQSTYPPGSVFKPVTLYGALAEGEIRRGQTLSPCLGGYRFGNRVFHCWKRAGHGVLNTVEALAQSCDVFFYQLATPLGVDGIARYAGILGLNELTGVDLPRETRDLIPDSEYYDGRYGKRGWGQGLALNLAIGQGEILVSPVALAQFAGVLGTRGTRMVPRLLKELGPEHRMGKHAVPSLDPSWTQLNLNLDALDEVRRGMRAAVSTGTAKGAAIPNVEVSGKTGTAQNPGYDHALFIAYAPAESPEVAVAVVLENRGHGGSVAAPVARRVLAAYFGVQPAPAALVRETD
jgi:penicillin-binding protein 2